MKEIREYISTRISPCDIITNKMSEPCNIELGNCRYIQTTVWNDEPRIDIREWQTEDAKRIPTRKGISLKLQRWKLLVEAFDSLDKALKEKSTYSSHIGGNVYASVKADNVCVDIGQHWLPPNQTEVVPSKKGITLRPAEYEKLKDVSSVIGDFLPDLNSIVPCPYQSDHMNQLGFLKCPECNPDNYTEW